MTAAKRSDGFARIALLGALAIAILLIGGTVATALAQEGGDEPAKDEVTYKVTGDVYFGEKSRFEKPCTVNRKKIFEKIPAYQKIKREGLDKSSARYFFLIKEANRVFKEKIKEVAEELEYDLVVEKGGIKPSKRTKVPDITKKVLEKLES